MRCQTSGWTDAARTRTKTSSSRTTGLSISWRRRTSSEPYRSWTIAFILVGAAYPVGCGRVLEQRLESLVPLLGHLHRAAVVVWVHAVAVVSNGVVPGPLIHD